jgi:hypothetical protein
MPARPQAFKESLVLRIEAGERSFGNCRVEGVPAIPARLRLID